MGDPVSSVTKTILVVDDNQDICAFMRAALEGAGYEVRTADEGAQALARQHERAADLLITDIFMPVLEGFETISRFKAHFPRTRIIAMSAGSSSGMKHDYLSTAGLLGVDATLHKPFDTEKLLDVVCKVLAPRLQE